MSSLETEPELDGLAFATEVAFDRGCSSGIGILLRWTVRLVGGAYFDSPFALLALDPSFKLIRLGPFGVGSLGVESYKTY